MDSQSKNLTCVQKTNPTVCVGRTQTGDNLALDHLGEQSGNKGTWPAIRNPVLNSIPMRYASCARHDPNFGQDGTQENIDGNIETYHGHGNANR